MNKYHIRILSILTIALFMLSVNGHVSQVSAQSQDLTTNFELLLMTNAGNRIRESYAFYIKQVVAPLGIQVDVLAKPFGQFVGDLLHFSSGQPFDLAIVALTGGAYPSFFDIYNTDGFFGSSMYQLTDPQVQSNFANDPNEAHRVNLTHEVDPLVLGAEFTLDPIERWNLTDQFAELFMNSLLYDLPLTTPQSRTAAWRGFGGENNELWDLFEGAIGSSKLGATWTDATPDARQENDSTIVFRTGDAQQKRMLDTYQVADVPTGEQSDNLAGTLLELDGSNNPHPNIAYQWFIEDATTANWQLTGNETTTNLDNMDNFSFKEKSRHTFIIDPSWQFSATTDVDGNPVGAHSVDANDVKVALDYLMHNNSDARGDLWQAQIANYTVSTTVSTDDTITIDLYRQSLTDFSLLGAIAPLPEHLLGGELTFQNDSITETFRLDDFTQPGTQDDHLNPSNTLEWEHWASPEGNTYAGQFELAEMDHDNGFWSMKARADYPFPNENTTMDIYDANTAALEAKHSSLNSTNTVAWPADNLRTFAPHTGVNNQSYYWAYDGFDGSTFPIEHIIYKVVSDDNAALIQFESGDLDFFGSSRAGAATVSDHENDENFVVKNIIPPGSPTFMVYNLKNEHLALRDVRYAIASVIDKVELTEVNDGFAVPAHSPVPPATDQFPFPEFEGAGPNGEDLTWYTPYAIPVDYEAARDLMRDNGYEAAETNDPAERADPAPVAPILETIGGALGADVWIGLSAFAITSVVLIRRRKFN